MSAHRSRVSPYRGFSRTHRTQRPRPPHRPTYHPRGRNLPTAPTVAGVKIDQTYHVWPPPPPTWAGPLEEWIVFWYLTAIKRYREGIDFYYQAALYVGSLFKSRDFTRGDFLINYGPESKAGAVSGVRGLVLDPFTEFTHSITLDKLRRTALALAGYRLVFIGQPMLESMTFYVMEQALKGHDISNRGLGG